MNHLRTAALPHVTVERIHIENSKVTVNAYLTTRGTNAAPYLMDEKYFSDFIKIYLILAPDDNETLRRMLADPRSRAANVLARGSAITTDIDVNWTEILLEGKEYRTITMSEAINQDSEINVSPSRIGGMSQGIASNLSDISFNVEIPLSRINLSNQDFETLHLYVFSHLDVAALVSEYGLSTELVSAANLLRIGGNLSADKILQRNQDGLLRVPEQVTILTRQDGTPYVGAYHYHDEPGVYQGYMEGPIDKMDRNTARLQTLTVQYKKVVANFLIEDGFFISGYNYSEEELDLLENNYVSPFVADQAALATVFQGANAYNGEYLLNIFDPDFQQELVQERFNRSLDIGTNGIIFNSVHSIQTETVSGVQTPYHKIEFEMDFKKLLKTRSKYPFFLNKLYTSLNYGEDVVLGSARVLTLSVYRRRLSNHPLSNNPVGTGAYADYEDDVEELVIRTSFDPSTPSRIQQTEDFQGTEIIQGSIEEEQDTTEAVRKFVIKDYKMAREINFGRYAYRVKIVVEDSVKSLINNFVEQFRGGLNYFNRFLVEASMPHRPPESAFNGALGLFEEEEQLTNAGSINIYTENYTESFLSTSQTKYDSMLRDLIRSYVRLYSLLSNKDITQDSVFSALSTAIVPNEGGTYTAALEFKNKCMEILRQYEQILKRDAVARPGGANSASSATDLIPVGNKHPGDSNSGLIEFSRDIPGYAEAFNVGEVMFSYDVDNLFDSARMSSRDPIAALLSGPTAADLEDFSSSGDGLWISPAAAVYSTGESLDNIVEFEDDDPDSEVVLETILDTDQERTARQAELWNNVRQSGFPYDPAVFGYAKSMPFAESLSTYFRTMGANNSNTEDDFTPGMGGAGGFIDVFGASTGNTYNSGDTNGGNSSQSVMNALAKKNGPGSKAGNTGQMLIKKGKSAVAEFVPMTLEVVKEIEASGVKKVMIKVDTPQPSKSTNNVTTVSIGAALEMVGGKPSSSNSSSGNKSNSSSSGGYSWYSSGAGNAYNAGLKSDIKVVTTQTGNSNTSNTGVSGQPRQAAPRRY